MKTKLLLASFAAGLSAAIMSAAPGDDLAAAAKKLSSAGNYSWTATTEIANSQFPAMPADGVTEKGGFTVITRTFNGNAMQTVRKGDQVVMQNPDGDWLTMEELRQQFAGGGGGGNRGGGGRGGFGFGGGQANPAEEVSNLVTKIKDAKVADGAIVATLSAEDVAPMLTFGRGGRGGQTPPAPKNASGSVKFWLKDGGLVKFVVAVKGTVTTPNGDEREVERTTTTELKNVGTTKVEVPDAAKKKLGT